MTVPCAILLFVLLPDLPSNSRAFYLTQEEKEFALTRAIDAGKVRPTFISSIPSLSLWIIRAGRERRADYLSPFPLSFLPSVSTGRSKDRPTAPQEDVLVLEVVRVRSWLRRLRYELPGFELLRYLAQ